MDLGNRFRGALLGLAVGDALGTTLEFRAPGTFTPITDMVGGGPFRLAPGCWTDDTSMALCLAESLVECGGFDAADQMRRYLRWRDEGYWSSNGRCFDIGITVSQALSRFAQSGNPFSGSTEERTAGNGSLMRLAPVPLRFAADAALAIAMAAESSRTTHGAASAVDACRYMSALIVGALRGVSKDELLSPHYSPVSNEWSERPLHPAIEEIAAGSFKRRGPPEIAGTGYVVRSLEAALWAFHGPGNFEAGALAAANLGDDADTTAAIFGQLAGAYYGVDAIPSRWRELVVRRVEIVELADRLLSAST